MANAGEISLQESVQSAIEDYKIDMNTCLPAVVVRVLDNLNYCQIDVQPSINIKGFDGSTTERPPILNVPVQFPSSSTSAITFPLNPGDPVLLIFSQRGLDAWKAGNGYATTPTDYRMMDYKDCFAIPCVWPKARSVNDPVKRRWPHNTRDLVVAHNVGSANEIELRLTEGGRIQFNSDIGMDINVPDIKITGTVTHTGILSSNGVILDVHTHTGVDTGPGVSGPPVK